MKNIRLFYLLCLSLILVFGSSPYALADEPLLKDIPLLWNPTEDVRTFKAVDLTIYHDIYFMVKPFKDFRKNPAEIGVNIERKGTSQDLPVTTKDNVAQWLTFNFSRTLSNFGVNVLQDKGNLTLEADILNFFVTEKSVYKGLVALKVRLLSKSNAVLWEQMVSGDSTRFGRSYTAPNYYEALSNSVIYAVYSLLRNDSFQRAVQKGK
ncbi:MAG: hypothetical protein HY787_00830 [Deltaproteobacteria bacterium]|nr:hypothetical protein [Deltaproteobacteria bacterium]